MRLLVTGACGFVGSTMLRSWAQRGGHELLGVDNLSRPGSERNRLELRRLGVRLFHADLRLQSDVDSLPPFDALVDAAANPSVLAGVDGRTSSRQLVEHNLVATVHMLERCRALRARFVLLSTSRVYSIPPLSALPVRVANGAFEPEPGAALPKGVSEHGVDESFSTAPPTSLYGTTKVASEQLALEYGDAFGFPVFINRCGILAGAGQFGRPDQGILAYWIHSWRWRRPLRYVGFDGEGHQVRDCLHPCDLVPLVERQLGARDLGLPRIVNVSGGLPSAFSLRQLSEWCAARFGPHDVGSEATTRAFDIPWMVLDPQLANRTWDFAPERSRESILAEIADHADANADWLTLSDA